MASLKQSAARLYSGTGSAVMLVRRARIKIVAAVDDDEQVSLAERVAWRLGAADLKPAGAGNYFRERPGGGVPEVDTGVFS